MRNCFETELLEEELLYQQDWTDRRRLVSLYNKYDLHFRNFISQFSLRNNMRKDEVFSYISFSLNYVNKYFGLLQCIQIDCLRYAISRLDSEKKLLVQGVLTATVRRILSAHRNCLLKSSCVSEDNIVGLLNAHHISVFHEFSRRLLSVAKESEFCPHRVISLKQIDLNLRNFANTKNDDDSVIFINALSLYDNRWQDYQDVFDTLLDCKYPLNRKPPKSVQFNICSCNSSGLISVPLMQHSVNLLFADMIKSAIFAGKKCLWSCSNTENYSIFNVVNTVRLGTNCIVHSFCDKISDNKVDYFFIFIPF